MNFLAIIKNYLPANIIEDAAKKTGESTNSISSLINAAIPAVLGGLISKSSTDNKEAFSIVQNVAKSWQVNNLVGMLNGLDSGNFDIWSIIKSLFGDKADYLISMLAGFAGVKDSSAKTVLGLSSVATLGAVGSYVKENNLDQIGFASFLNTQKAKLSSWIPAGFDFSGLTSLLGLGSLFSASNNAAGTGATINVNNNTSAFNSNPEEPKKGNSWLVPLIILAAVAALIWWLMKGCNKEESAEVAQTTAISSSDTTKLVTDASATVSTAVATVSGKLDEFGNWIADWGAEQTIKLADGTEVKVGQNSTEYKLYQFITNAAFQIDTVDKTKNWVSFDRVYFETGKSILTQQSQDQIKNIALILKNYPQAGIKIGGYTDNTGNADVNKKVSDERAKIVAKELIKLGAGAQQINEAVGYGPEHPIATNDTEEGKAQNRRVDLKVATK